jgi:hypothetical protein
MPRIFILGAAAVLVTRPLAAQQTPDLAPYLMSDRAAEVALARTAAPSSISDSATVLVLTRRGFETAASGTNGFTCAVLRSFLGPIGDPNSWNPRVRAPHCFNPPATRTVLKEIEARAEWVMAGVNPSEIATRVQRAYAAHQFPMPAAGAMTYMMSHEQYLLDDDPHWMPHLMIYADNSLRDATWGADFAGAPVFDVSGTNAYSPVRVLAIPVRKWSDGTPALPGGGHED